MKREHIKRVLSMMTAFVIALSLLVTGTLAYVLRDQHDSSYLTVQAESIFDLILINNFKSYNKDDWAKDEAVDNPIYIKSNPGTAHETYTDAFVAIQLKEYIHASKRGDWVVTQDDRIALFAIDQNRNYMPYAQAIAAGVTDCAKYPADVADADAFAIINNTQTQADANAMLGIHGKPKRSGETIFSYGNRAALEAVLAGGAQSAASDECGATPIDGWNGVDGQTHARDYVSLGFGDVQLLTDWLDAYHANPNDPALTGAFWILGDNGWAYWAQALKPNTKTTDLIKTIKLEKNVSEITYYMHVDMLAASREDIGVLQTGAGMPQQLIDLLNPPPTPDLP